MSDECKCGATESKADEAVVCAPNEELIDGECRRVAVTCEITIESVDTRIEAATGETVIRISGIAFHDGINKNNWGIRPELAVRLASDMIGADVTLNHPTAEHGRFTRNMDGGVNEAVVGIITEASFHATESDYQVKYVAEIHRSELFEALESGLWMRPDYGVSIGGTGIPSEVVESSEGEHVMWFADEFAFDHLAIVHRPAYSDANIETVERVKTPEAAETIKYQTDCSPLQSEVEQMSDEIIENTEVDPEMESLRAELVLREAKIAEFEAMEATRVEDYRISLVSKASTMGLKNHDDFTTETLESMIASWEASKPVVETPEVSMEAAVPAASEPVEASESDEPVVANFLNGIKVETPQTLYARAYDSWVVAYNAVTDGDFTPALLYKEINN